MITSFCRFIFTMIQNIFCEILSSLEGVNYTFTLLVYGYVSTVPVYWNVVQSVHTQACPSRRSAAYAHIDARIKAKGSTVDTPLDRSLALN